MIENPYFATLFNPIKPNHLQRVAQKEKCMEPLKRSFVFEERDFNSR